MKWQKKYIVGLFLLFLFIVLYSQNESKKDNKDDVFCRDLTYNNPSFFDSCKKNYRAYKFIKSKLIHRINYSIKQNKIYNEKVKELNKMDLNINQNLYKRVDYKELSSVKLEYISNKKIKFYTRFDIPKLDKTVLDKDSQKVYKVEPDHVVEFGSGLDIYFNTSLIVEEINIDKTEAALQYRGFKTETFFDSVKVRKKIIKIKDCMIPIKNRETGDTMFDEYGANYSERLGFLSNSEHDWNTNTVCFPKSYFSDPFFPELTRFDFLHWGNINGVEHDVFILIEAYRTYDNIEIIRIYIKDIIFKEINKSPEDIFSEVINPYINTRSLKRDPEELKNFKEFAKIFWKRVIPKKDGETISEYLKRIEKN